MIFHTHAVLSRSVRVGLADTLRRAGFGLSLLCPLLPPTSADLAAKASNVLLILTDDQGYGDLSLHGNTVLETPNIDRFAREGVQFRHFYVSPVCAPTRASLLTGRWWQRGGVHGVSRGREIMRAGEVTIAQTFKAAGYRTGMFGKWHNGEQYPYTPAGNGFDEFLGFNTGHWNQYFNPELLRGSQPEKTKGYITDVLTDAAIAFIERDPGIPFFCYVPYNAPHTPLQVPDRYFDKYTAKGCEPKLAAIYGMCENIDDNVQRLLDALDRRGLRENTIVIFLSDNGPTSIRRYNAGLRGAKASVHEGGTRVPCFVQYPARLSEPRVVPQIAAHIDLYPTLLELCGIDLPANHPPMDGVSLVPLLQGADAGWPERLLYTHQALLTGPPAPQPGAVRNSRYRAVIAAGKDATWQLYDIMNDPGETHDIAAGHPDLIASLASAYDAWWRDVSQNGFDIPSLPVGHPEHNPVRLYAPQADLTGELRYFVPQAYSNTWITGWTNVRDTISFAVNVTHAGTYDVSLVFGCLAADAGSVVRIRGGRDSAEAVVPAAPAPIVPLPNRDGPHDNYTSRSWNRLDVGRLWLSAGEQTLTLEAVAKPGEQVLELKHVELLRLDWRE